MLPFFCTKKSSLIGLYIQAEELSLIHVKKIRHLPSIESFESVKIAPGVIMDGKIIDFNKALLALRELVLRTDTVGCDAAFALPGYCVISKRLDLTHAVSEEECEADINTHRELYLPGVTDEIFFDYYDISNNGINKQIMLIAAKKDLVNTYIDLIQQTGLKVKIVDVDYYALARMLSLCTKNKAQPLVLIDVGLTAIHIVFLQDENVLLTKQINLAHFTQDFFQNLAQQIQQCIQSCSAIHKQLRVEKIVLSGKSLLLKNIHCYLAEVLAIPIEFPHVSFQVSTEFLSRSMLCLGLGLHGGQYD